ncbi:DUF3106 domain-containing protein [Noviherbaspirillum soli]|uniref:DUF3106 domain-containing protein n=1 Tax=Noviherbaspirillum soli TaxID=1064518 RepID=UPI001E4056A3|nr:DUF3106 domain-containing protein [Noviherbaspirillum soli]
MTGLLRSLPALLACALALPPAAHSNSIGTQPSITLIKAAAPAKPAPVAKPLWQDLSQEQQQALSPLAADWDKLDAARKKKWIELTRHYSSLTPDQQARMQERMREWAKLSPEERRVARESYARAKRLEPEQKNAQWEKYQQLSEEQKSKLAEETLARKRVTVLPPAAQDNGKLVPPSKAVLRQPDAQKKAAQPVPQPAQQPQEQQPPLLPSISK